MLSLLFVCSAKFRSEFISYATTDTFTVPTDGPTNQLSASWKHLSERRTFPTSLSIIGVIVLAGVVVDVFSAFGGACDAHVGLDQLCAKHVLH